VTPAVRFDGLAASSAKSSAAAAGASRKSGNRPELLLRRALRALRISYQLNRLNLPGVPDFVFARARLAVFVDGDFWHGKDWKRRKLKLAKGHNAAYWITKIEGNRARDLSQNRKLRSMGWTVLRFWESDVFKRTEYVVRRIEAMLREHR
jgi:DNA mismatch endonuclease (patch repair protein)